MLWKYKRVSYIELKINSDLEKMITGLEDLESEVCEPTKAMAEDLTRWVNKNGDNQLNAAKEILQCFIDLNVPVAILPIPSLARLSFFETQLKTLPPQIGQLTSLTALDLAFNELQRLPTEIGNLNGLKKLDLTINKLIHLPPQIGQLTSLTALDLARNKLIHLPPQIGQLIRLTELCLSENQLDVLPKEIGGLNELKKLDLSRNQLIYLPSEMGALVCLKDLDLSRNRLVSLPTELVVLTGLTALHLDSNQLTHLPELKGLSKLRELYLSWNYLSESECEKLPSAGRVDIQNDREEWCKAYEKCDRELKEKTKGMLKQLMNREMGGRRVCDSVMSGLMETRCELFAVGIREDWRTRNQDVDHFLAL